MDKRFVLAIALVVLVLFVHWKVVMPLLTPKAPERAATGDNAPGGPSPRFVADNGTVPPVPTPTPTPSPSPTPTPAPPETPGALYAAADQDNAPVRSDLVLSNDLFTTRWTNRYTGACLGLTFDDFYTDVTREEKLTLLGNFTSVVAGPNAERESASLAVEFPELGAALAGMTMRVVRAADNEIVFAGKILSRDAQGAWHEFLEVTKSVRAPKGAYEITVEVSVRNLTAMPLPLAYDFRVLEGITVEGDYRSDASGRVMLRSEKGFPVLRTQAVGKLSAAVTEGSGNCRWAGADDRYFAALAWAEADGKPVWMESATVEPLQARLSPSAAPLNTVRVKLLNRLAPLAPGAADVRTFHLFAGPKRSDVLDGYADLGMPRLVDYGWFGFIAIGFLWMLRGIHLVVRNYGVAILVLTLVIRAVLHPLTKKGQVAMAKMQRLKPKITELQKRYKNDKQKLAAEQMKLWREAGVSPASGCLPVLLQMPVLFALFWALRLTFDLRQSPFVAWIADLSRPDTVGHFPAGIPFIGGAPVNLLPILMTVAMFIQQLMQPKAEDEQSRQQQKMMMFLPFMFMFFFYSFPSGLSLYWFASTAIGIAEQWYIKRHIDETLGAAAKA